MSVTIADSTQYRYLSVTMSDCQVTESYPHKFQIVPNRFYLKKNINVENLKFFKINKSHNIHFISVIYNKSHVIYNQALLQNPILPHCTTDVGPKFFVQWSSLNHIPFPSCLNLETPTTFSELKINRSWIRILVKKHRLRNMYTLQIASISSKIIACKQLWSPGELRT